MDVDDDDLGEIVDPADLPEPAPRKRGYTRIGQASLARLLNFARGDPQLTAWEERFILTLSREDTGTPVTRQEWITLGRIAHRIGFRP